MNISELNVNLSSFSSQQLEEQVAQDQVSQQLDSGLKYTCSVWCAGQM